MTFDGTFWGCVIFAVIFGFCVILWECLFDDQFAGSPLVIDSSKKYSQCINDWKADAEQAYKYQTENGDDVELKTPLAMQRIFCAQEALDTTFTGLTFEVN